MQVQIIQRLEMIKPIMYANLHNHSTHSDGVYNVEKITDIIKNEGYLAAALTDHDTVTGNVEMKSACAARCMESIFGCEFMTRSDVIDKAFHLTAFDFDPDEPEMKEYLRRCSITMTEKTRIIFERGKDLELLPKELTWDAVVRDNPGVSWLCNDHVFRTMKRMGIAEDKDYPDFYDGIFVKHGYGITPAYPKLPLEDIVPFIRRAGGTVVVAHPHGQLDTLPYLKSLGVEGIEVWHPDLTPDEIPTALGIARDLELYVSGGPDHSGLSGGQYSFFEDYKSSVWYVPELSCGTTKELFYEIKNRKLLPERKELINEYLEYYSTGGEGV